MTEVSRYTTIDDERRWLAAQKPGAARVALEALLRVAKNNVHPAASVAAARSLAEFAGILGPNRDPVNKDPESMTPEELRTFIAKAETALAERATPVNAPIARPIDDQLSDMLG